MNWRILTGDSVACLRSLPDGIARTCVTSPPYWGLRDYGVDGQIGLERTPDEYVARLVDVFREVRRVLADDGTCWLNLGDSYAQGGFGGCSPSSTLAGGGGRYRDGSKLETMHVASLGRRAPAGLKPKDLVGIPWRVAFALQADGWWLRSDIIWSKPNPMPESVTDRPTKAHEYVFLLAKAERYFYDADAIREPWADDRLGFSGSTRSKYDGRVERQDGGLVRAPEVDGRNKRSVWCIATQPFPEAHFAVMPEALVDPCVLAGSAQGDVVLDPFAGSGTVGVVALKKHRSFIGCELNPEYVRMAQRRLSGVAPLFAQEATP